MNYTSFFFYFILTWTGNSFLRVASLQTSLTYSFLWRAVRTLSFSPISKRKIIACLPHSSHPSGYKSISESSGDFCQQIIKHIFIILNQMYPMYQLIYQINPQSLNRLGWFTFYHILFLCQVFKSVLFMLNNRHNNKQ